MSKKGKFNLTNLVQKGYLNDGQTLCFVSDPSKTCQIMKQPGGEYKVGTTEGEITTIHGFATDCLKTDPPGHASKWLRTEGGTTLYDVWQQANEELNAA